jgi:hypothetical protein
VGDELRPKTDQQLVKKYKSVARSTSREASAVERIALLVEL